MNIVNIATLLVISAFAYGVPQPSVRDGPIVRDQKMEYLPGDGSDHELNQLRVNLEDESNRYGAERCNSGLSDCYKWNDKCWIGEGLMKNPDQTECGGSQCKECILACQHETDCPDGGANYQCWRTVGWRTFGGQNGQKYCSCPDGLTEKDNKCKKPECPDNCSGNGWCKTDETCQCYFGYEGVDCSVIKACEDEDPYRCEKYGKYENFCDHPEAQKMCPKSCNKCSNEKCQHASYDGGFYQPILISGSCYRLSKTATKTWSEAKKICQSNDGKLFEPRESVKSQAVVDYIRYIYNDNGIWIGLTDAASEGNWQYASDGNLASYTNWHLDEPNNAGDGENCAIIHSGHRDWFDYPCEAQNYFLCQF